MMTSLTHARGKQPRHDNKQGLEIPESAKEAVKHENSGTRVYPNHL